MRKSKIHAPKQTQEDGFKTLHEKVKVKSRHSTPLSQHIYTTLDTYFTNYGILRRGVQYPIDQAIKGNIDFGSLNVPQFNLSRTITYSKSQMKKDFRRLHTFTRTYGAAIALPIFDTAEPFDQPLQPNIKRKLLHLQIYENYRVSPDTVNLDSNPFSPNFNKPLYYYIQTDNPAFARLRVHYSRLFIDEGETQSYHRNSYRTKAKGESILLGALYYVDKYHHSLESSESILEDYETTTITVNNLQDMILMGKEDAVQKRLKILDESRSILNVVLLDENEKYSKTSSSVAGVDKLIQEFQIALAASFGLPVSILFGRSPAGQNATGEADMEILASTCENIRDYSYLPFLQWILNIQNLQTEEITLPPIRTPKYKEDAEYRNIIGQNMERMINLGVLTAEEVRQSLYGGDKGFTINVNIDNNKHAKNEFNDPNKTDIVATTKPKTSTNDRNVNDVRGDTDKEN